MTFYKAYALYNAKTNQPVVGTNAKNGANFYIIAPYNVKTKVPSLTQNLKNALTTPLSKLTSNLLDDITTELKEKDVYAQPNLKISYNIKDKVGVKKVKDVISDSDDVKLYIKEVPVTGDTNDNYVYKDENMYYGTYAVPVIPNDNESDKQAEVKLFSVIAGPKKIHMQLLMIQEL